MKKILSMIMVLTMGLIMVACGSKEETTETALSEKASTNAEEVGEDLDAIYPDETILIGVEIYDTTDTEILALQDYFSYLSEEFNVKFKYSEAIQDAEMEMKFIEDCAVAGAKGFIAYYNVTGDEQYEKVFEYGMYMWGGAEDELRYDLYKENPLYLGSIDSGDLNYEGGKAMGEWVVENGFDTVIYASGGADFGVSIFIDRQKGFLDGIGDAAVEVIAVSGFPNEQFFALQGAALATEGLDAVVASFNGVDFWAQPIATAGLSETVKLASFGSVTKTYVDSFESGIIDLMISQNLQTFGLAVPTIINAIDGNTEAIQVDSLPTNTVGSMWVINSAEDIKKLYDIQENARFIREKI